MGAFNRPQSRNEAILQNMLGANNVIGAPQSRIEELFRKGGDKLCFMDLMLEKTKQR